MKLFNRRAIVTGGCSGIGEAIVRLFCREGARVMISDVNETAGAALVEELKGQGADVFFYKTNVSVPEEVERSVQAAVEYFGGLDILISNAGIVEQDNLLEDVPIQTWQQVIGINLSGMFYSAKYALPYLRESKGCIVNMGSICSLVATKYDPSYCASKGGILGLTRSIAADYAQFGVRCNAIAPGMCDSPMMRAFTDQMNPEEYAQRLKNGWAGPAGRFCTPEEVANAALFLASDDAGYISGTVLPVDGGYTAV